MNKKILNKITVMLSGICIIFSMSSCKKDPVECERCNGTAKITCNRCIDRRCGECEGDGREKCTECGGDGKMICTICLGRGWYKNGWGQEFSCEKEVHCDECWGAGNMYCYTCGGDGLTKGTCSCYNGKIDCPDCESGYVD